MSPTPDWLRDRIRRLLNRLDEDRAFVDRMNRRAEAEAGDYSRAECDAAIHDHDSSEAHLAGALRSDADGPGAAMVDGRLMVTFAEPEECTYEQGAWRLVEVPLDAVRDLDGKGGRP